MKTKWVLFFGAAILAFVLADEAKADPYYRGYGYGNYGYAPSYGYGGFYNRTDHYHYTHPRVTTGAGFRSVYRPYGYGGYYGGFGRGVNVRYPGGGVNVFNGYGGRVNVYGGWGGVNVGW